MAADNMKTVQVRDSLTGEMIEVQVPDNPNAVAGRQKNVFGGNAVATKPDGSPASEDKGTPADAAAATLRDAQFGGNVDSTRPASSRSTDSAAMGGVASAPTSPN